MRLYEIDKSIEQVIENGFSVDEETGELLFSSEDLEKLSIDRSSKIENTALVIKNYLALAEDIKQEETVLKERRNSILKRADYLQNLLSMSLNGEKFETAKCSISFRKSAKVIIDENVNLPEEYTKSIIKVEPNKAEIKNALKQGIEIKGCRIEETQNIQIK